MISPPRIDSEKDIIAFLKPETELERQIMSDKEFIEGALFGYPRPGHPEGQVVSHIREVLDNVEKYSTKENRQVLRLIAIVHDTFKYKVDISQRKIGSNNHAYIAKQFSKKYCSDKIILDIIELHDEAFSAYQNGARDNNWQKAEERARQLLHRLGSSVSLYLTFYKCDNETGDKNQECFVWFEGFIKKNRQPR